MFSFFITFRHHWLFSRISSSFPQKTDFLSSLNCLLKEEKKAYFPWSHEFFSLKPYKIGPFILWSLKKYPQEVPYYHLHNLIEHYPWPGCLTDDKGHLCYMNSPLGRLLGYGGSDLQGKPLVELFLTPPGPDHFPGKIYTLMGAHNTPVSMTITQSVVLGKYIAIFLFPADVSNEGSGDLHWLCKMPMAAALLDETGMIQMMNGSLKKMLNGHEGTHLSHWIQEKDRQTFSQELRRLRRLENPIGSLFLSFILPCDEKPLSQKEKLESFKIFLTFFPPRPSGGGKFLVFFTPKDMGTTTMQNLSTEFQDYSKEEISSFYAENSGTDEQKMHLLGQVSSGIIHDFNNLLTGMLGFCDLLLQRHPQGDASFKDIDQIRQSALRGARLIQQLLCFSKSVPITKHTLCLKTCLMDLLPLLHRMLGPRVVLNFEEKPAQEETKSADKKHFHPWKNNPISFTTFGDVGHLEQILLNLSINARDAMAQEGSLTFGLFHRWIKTPHKVVKNTLKPGCYIILEVKDTGSGISKELMERIFDPFFSTKGQKGTGIGLSNVLQLMNQWGGGLEIYSSPKGTIFDLYFPYDVQGSPKNLMENSPHGFPQGQKSPSMEEGPSSVHGVSTLLENTALPMEKKILLVEDEDPVRLFAARALKEKKYHVTEARDGQQALHLLKTKGPFSLIITDVMMPGMNGPTLVTHGRKLFPDIKILFVSGYPEEEVRTYLSKDMADVFFLQKPFTLDDLVKRVASL